MTAAFFALRWLVEHAANRAVGVATSSGWAEAAKVEAALARPLGDALHCLHLLAYAECRDSPAGPLYRASADGARYVAEVDRASLPRMPPLLHSDWTRIPLTSGG